MADIDIAELRRDWSQSLNGPMRTIARDRLLVCIPALLDEIERLRAKVDLHEKREQATCEVAAASTEWKHRARRAEVENERLRRVRDAASALRVQRDIDCSFNNPVATEFCAALDAAKETP